MFGAAIKRRDDTPSLGPVVASTSTTVRFGRLGGVVDRTPTYADSSLLISDYASALTSYFGPREGATMSVRSEVLAANDEYAANFGAKSDLPLPPARRFAILTCMDARLDPARYAGLSEGDAHVIRNAGGRASDDAIRSLVISYKLLGTSEWLVIHHTGSGMLAFTDEVMRDLLASSLEAAELTADGFVDVGTGPGSVEGQYINWL